MALECNPECPAESRERCMAAFGAWALFVIKQADHTSDLPAEKRLVIAAEKREDAVNVLCTVVAPNLHCTNEGNRPGVDYRLAQSIVEQLDQPPSTIDF